MTISRYNHVLLSYSDFHKYLKIITAKKKKEKEERKIFLKTCYAPWHIIMSNLLHLLTVMIVFFAA